MDLKEYRKKVFLEIREALVRTKTTAYRADLNEHIQFTAEGIKECINQPIYNNEALYLEKIELIEERLKEALETAVYIGFTEYQTHPKEHILGYHYFETKTKSGDTLYFNVQLTVQRKLVLYSITQRVRME